jgi:hypothetical protein
VSVAQMVLLLVAQTALHWAAAWAVQKVPPLAVGWAAQTAQWLAAHSVQRWVGDLVAQMAHSWVGWRGQHWADWLAGQRAHLKAVVSVAQTVLLLVAQTALHWAAAWAVQSVRWRVEV